MKANKTLMIALIAGVAVAGLVSFLFATEKGKKISKKWKNQGKRYVGQFGEIFDEAKEKFAVCKEDILKENKKNQFAETTNV